MGVLAPTPYMGWDTYFAFGSHYNEATVLEQASQMRTKGLIKAGYATCGWTWAGGRAPATRRGKSP